MRNNRHCGTALGRLTNEEVDKLHLFERHLGAIDGLLRDGAGFYDIHQSARDTRSYLIHMYSHQQVITAVYVDVLYKGQHPGFLYCMRDEGKIRGGKGKGIW